MTMRIMAVFFDTLGTLWEMEPGLDERVAHGCEARGLGVTPAEVRYQRARLLDELRLRFSDGQYKTPAQAEAYWQAFYQRLLAALGVPAEQLAGLAGELLEAFGLADSFAHCLISSELGAEKPESRIFALAAEQAGVAPGALLYAGNDPLEDMTGAEVAACQAVLVDRGGRYSTSYLQWRRVRRLDEIARVIATPSAVLE